MRIFNRIKAVMRLVWNKTQRGLRGLQGLWEHTVPSHGLRPFRASYMGSFVKFSFRRFFFMFTYLVQPWKSSRTTLGFNVFAHLLVSPVANRGHCRHTLQAAICCRWLLLKFLQPPGKSMSSL